MTQERKRTTVTCGNIKCGKQFSIQDSELSRRLRKSANGRVFCSQICFQNFCQMRRLGKMQKQE